MTRSEVNERINELLQRILALNSEPPSTIQAVNDLRQMEINLLTNHKKDLTLIYYMHLYKLP